MAHSGALPRHHALHAPTCAAGLPVQQGKTTQRKCQVFAGFKNRSSDTGYEKAGEKTGRGGWGLAEHLEQEALLRRASLLPATSPLSSNLCLLKERTAPKDIIRQGTGTGLDGSTAGLGHRSTREPFQNRRLKRRTHEPNQAQLVLLFPAFKKDVFRY